MCDVAGIIRQALPRHRSRSGTDSCPESCSETASSGAPLKPAQRYAFPRAPLRGTSTRDRTSPHRVTAAGGLFGQMTTQTPSLFGKATTLAQSIPRVWPRLQGVPRALHQRRLEHLHHIAQASRRLNGAVHYHDSQPKLLVHAESARAQGGTRIQWIHQCII
jgi:hypothetical protein